MKIFGIEFKIGSTLDLFVTAKSYLDQFGSVEALALQLVTVQNDHLIPGLHAISLSRKECDSEQLWIRLTVDRNVDQTTAEEFTSSTIPLPPTA